MWLHGVGWFLPQEMDFCWLGIHRHQQLLYASCLEADPEPPLSLSPHRHYRQLPLTTGLHPANSIPLPLESLQAREAPPSGVQLWPGRCIYFRLLVPWHSRFRPLAAQWPMDHWSPYLRIWNIQPCATNLFHWCPGPWQPASPSVFIPCQVTYHSISGMAEWTFCLKER